MENRGKPGLKKITGENREFSEPAGTGRGFSEPAGTGARLPAPGYAPVPSLFVIGQMIKGNVANNLRT